MGRRTLCCWAGDKAIGGKMFAVVDLGKGGPVMSYAAGPERFAELVEREGIIPAPYLARAHWVAVERWDVFRASEWQSELAGGACVDLREAAEANARCAGNAGREKADCREEEEARGDGEVAITVA